MYAFPRLNCTHRHPHPGNRQPAASRSGVHPAPGVRGQARPGQVHRLGGQVGRDRRKDPDRQQDRGPGHRGSGEAHQPGVTTDQLDKVGHEFLLDHKAYPSTLGYRGFPKSLCSSLNEVICHGIPDSTVVQDGDIINIDITAFINGVHGDTNYTFLVGDVDEESRLLVERTQESLNRAIKAVAPGREINVIGRAIQSYAKRFGYGVVRDFTGHGVGEAFHTGLIIPHYDAAPAYSTVIEPGMVFTIEPMLTLGTIEWDMWADDWTVVTRDHKRTAQFEHTLLVTDSGAEILTLP